MPWDGPPLQPSPAERWYIEQRRRQQYEDAAAEAAWWASLSEAQRAEVQAQRAVQAQAQRDAQERFRQRTAHEAKLVEEARNQNAALFSAQRCERCGPASDPANTCTTCAEAVAPVHLVAEVGDIATGVMPDVRWANGRSDGLNSSPRRMECDHCANRRVAAKHLNQALTAHEKSRPHFLPAHIPWREVRSQAFLWGVLSLIPLGLLLSTVRSFVLLAVGVVVAAAVGGGLRYERHADRVDLALSRNDDLLRRHDSASQTFKQQLAWLEELGPVTD
jgi:hypothetical protein